MNDQNFCSFLILIQAIYALLMIVFPFFGKVFLSLFLIFVLFCISKMRMRLSIAFKIYEAVSHLRNYKYFQSRVNRALEEEFKKSKSFRIYSLYRAYIAQIRLQELSNQNPSSNLFIRKIIKNRTIQVSHFSQLYYIFIVLLYYFYLPFINTCGRVKFSNPVVYLRL